MKKLWRILQAAAGKEKQLLALSNGTTLQADVGENEEPPKVKGVAYNGGKLQVQGWFYPVVVDLEALDIPDKVRLDVDHSSKVIDKIGSVSAQIEDGKLLYSGNMTGKSSTVENILALNEAGEDWEVSIDARVMRDKLIETGETETVNGQEFEGPFILATQSRLCAISVVTQGADDNSTLDLAAQAAGGNIMEFEKWLKAKGFDKETLSDSQIVTLKAAFDAEQEADENEGGEGEGAQASNGEGEGVDFQAQADEAIKKVRADTAAEMERIDGIKAICSTYESNVKAETVADLRGKAINGDITSEKLELELMRAGSPTVGSHVQGANGKHGPSDNKVLVAALRLGSGENQSDIEKAYDEKTLESAYSHRQMGAKDLIRLCASRDGLTVPKPGSGVEQYIQAAFSSVSLSEILGDVSQKMLVAGYEEVPSVAVKISRKLSAQNFKTMTGYRMTGERTLDKVPADGEITHAKLDEEEVFDYNVDTYGKMIALTRQAIINDELGAFTDVPRRYGRGAMETRERLFWTLVLDNTSTFFGSGNNNLLEGEDTDLDTDGLDAVRKMLEEQTGPDGEPIIVNGRYLVVPPALIGQAERLYKSQNLKGSTDAVDANIHQNRYEPLSTAYLSNDTFHASANDADWYLFADPVTVAAFGIAYLNGRETPISESVSMPSNVLGQGWRVYYDVGVCQIDYRGAIKSDNNS